MSETIIPHLHTTHKDTRSSQAQTIARHAWALAARLDYLTHGQGRAITEPTRQRILRRMALDARTLATSALDMSHASAPTPAPTPVEPSSMSSRPASASSAHNGKGGKHGKGGAA